jgi:hypothetical protein
MKTVYVDQPEEFWRILFSAEYVVHGAEVITDDCMYLTYKTTEETLDTNNKVNVILAAFTTCYARLHLYQFLQAKNRDVIYCDTGERF